MAKAHFVMLAETYNPKKNTFGEKWLSEKLDGVRCLWDGGVSRGILASEVPWSNTSKHERLVSPPVSTGLWTRYGQTVSAPDWFIDQLPKFPLDGELYLGVGRFQETVSIIKSFAKPKDWNEVKYIVFDQPDPAKLFETREIDVPTAKFSVKPNSYGWFKEKCFDCPQPYKTIADLNQTLTSMKHSSNVSGMKMERLPANEDIARNIVDKKFKEIIEYKGEGLMLRENAQIWEPIRVKGLFKLKPTMDSEAIVVGYVFARKGKIQGKVGALICEWNEGRRFQLSGFAEIDRILDSEDSKTYALSHLGEEAPEWIYCPSFPKGTTVTFKYREETVDGYPKEPRFWRKYNG